MTAATGQRSGKFRHIYGDHGKPANHFLEIPKPFTSGEGSYVVANGKFLAVALIGGGGRVMVMRLDKPGRTPMNQPYISVHKGKTLDMDFHPFIDSMIATASEDCSVAVTSFPAEGLTENVLEPAVKLKGHQKKVGLVQFNPSANSILASASFDRTVKVWNIETEECVSSYEEPKDNIYSLEWNADGSQLAVTGKDKKLRIFDPRAPEQAAVVDSFDGTKSSKCFWIPNLQWIGSTGFSKNAKRQLKFWDLRNLESPIFHTDIDHVASVLMPHYDYDNCILYLAGKGDGTVSFGEIVNDNKRWYPLGAYRNNAPQKGGGWISKRGCDVWKCEVNRFLKLTKNSIIPVRFIVPRKSGSEVFQEDIFPDCLAPKPAISAEDWMAGKNADCVRMSMDPAKRKDGEGGGAVFTKAKTYADLVAENKQLKEKLAALQKQAGIDPNSNSNSNADAPEEKDEETGAD